MLNEKIKTDKNAGKSNVLILDDPAINPKKLSEMLDRSYSVKLVSSEQEALSALNSSVKYDAFLASTYLCKGDFFDQYRLINTITPVVAVSTILPEALLNSNPQFRAALHQPVSYAPLTDIIHNGALLNEEKAYFKW